MKRSSLLPIAVLLACFAPLYGQQNSHAADQVLFTYGDREVTKGEFKYVFEKNNPEIDDPTVADLQDYLDLYVKFKVKVAAAQDARIDTLPEVRKDLKNYLDQLYNSYLDKLVLQPLMDEVKGRWNVDVRSRHILVSVPRGASAEVENEAYEKIMKIRERIVDGEDFDKVALETSDDRYVQRNKGDLGYVNVMRLPYYEFENKLYNTEVGEVSMPVRTPLGYHIIMPTQRRPAVGTVEVAHILVELSPDADEEAERAAREKIETVYNKLKEGAVFGKLARQYSDDEMTKTKEGRMEPFSAGEMVPRFENEAFSLTGDSSFTEPFRTRYGYHILMLLNKNEKASFEENEARLRREVKKDSRYQKALDAKKAQFIKEYGFAEKDANLAYVAVELDSSVYSDGFFAPQVEGSQPLFEIEGTEFTAADLYRHIERYQPYSKKKNFQDITEEAYNTFKERTIMETAIADKYPDYVQLKQEYKDGILMFAMMQDSVWNKAIQDTAGLQAYYQQHKGQYKWGQRVDATVFYVNDPQSIALKRLKRHAGRLTQAELYDKYNDSLNMNLRIDSMVVERGMNDLIDQVEWHKGWSSKLPYAEGNGYHLVKINRVIPPEPKTLQEARGAYLADYQTVLEAHWVATLKQRYPVKINRDVLQSLAE